jgi:hypothetical protein
LYSPCDPSQLFQFLNPYTVGRTPWIEDQPVARPLCTPRTTQTEWTYTNTDIHASSGTRTHDPSFRAGEDCSCLRPRVHCDQSSLPLPFLIFRNRRVHYSECIIFVQTMFSLPCSVFTCSYVLLEYIFMICRVIVTVTLILQRHMLQLQNNYYARLDYMTVHCRT